MNIIEELRLYAKGDGMNTFIINHKEAREIVEEFDKLDGLDKVEYKKAFYIAEKRTHRIALESIRPDGQVTLKQALAAAYMQGLCDIARSREMSREIKPCPFCGAAPVFPDAKDVYGTCYDAGCEECDIPTISIQIIDCFDHPRGHVHDSWNETKMQYGIEYIEVARQEAIQAWNTRTNTSK